MVESFCLILLTIGVLIGIFCLNLTYYCFENKRYKIALKDSKAYRKSLKEYNEE